MTLGKFGKDERLNLKLDECPNPGPGAYDPNFKFKKLSQKIGTSHRADVAGTAINFPGPGMYERKSAISNVNWDNNNNFNTQQEVSSHKFGQDKNRFKGPNPNPVGPGKQKYKDNFNDCVEKNSGYSVGTGGRSNFVRNPGVPGPGAHEFYDARDKF